MFRDVKVGDINGQSGMLGAVGDAGTNLCHEPLDPPRWHKASFQDGLLREEGSVKDFQTPVLPLASKLQVRSPPSPLQPCLLALACLLALQRLPVSHPGCSLQDRPILNQWAETSHLTERSSGIASAQPLSSMVAISAGCGVLACHPKICWLSHSAGGWWLRKEPLNTRPMETITPAPHWGSHRAQPLTSPAWSLVGPTSLSNRWVPLPQSCPAEHG